MSLMPSKISLDRVEARAFEERHGLLYYLGWGLFFMILAWAWNGSEMRPWDLIRDSGNMGKYAADFFLPALKIGNFM